MKGLGELLVPVGALGWLGGMLVGAFEIVYWLKKGFWSGNTLAAVFGEYHVKDWSGVTQIIVWVWAQPLWSVITAAGIAVILFGIALASTD